MKIRSRRSGFSLVELLTVIAIIAILAAIIFPVMGTVKERARQNQCMTQLQQIGMGLDMYKKDNRKYPQTLGPQWVDGTAAVPFQSNTSCQNCLFPEYVKSFKMFHCPDSQVMNTSDTVPLMDSAGNNVQDSNGNNINVYAYDSYDSYVQGTMMPYTTTPCYLVQRTADTADPDYSRQLKFRTPPTDTVVTWCSNHIAYKKALVLFIDGHVEVMSATDVQSQTWKITPRP